jgi:hypothetical protein
MFRDKMIESYMQQDAHINVRSAMDNIFKVKSIFNGSLFKMIVIQRIKWPGVGVTVADEYQIHALY